MDRECGSSRIDLDYELRSDVLAELLAVGSVAGAVVFTVASAKNSRIPRLMLPLPKRTVKPVLDKLAPVCPNCYSPQL
jgi:hypothetical protein